MKQGLKPLTPTALQEAGVYAFRLLRSLSASSQPLTSPLLHRNGARGAEMVKLRFFDLVCPKVWLQGFRNLNAPVCLLVGLDKCDEQAWQCRS